MSSNVLIHELPSIGKCLLSSRSILKHQTVLQGTGNILNHPTTYTIQLSETQHCNVQAPLMYTSHSCQPNTRIVFTPNTISSLSSTISPTINTKQTNISSFSDTIYVNLIAIHDIEPKTLISFDYCTSEWQMASPFPCNCGAPNCRGIIEGYKHLLYNQPEIALSLLPLCTAFIQSKTIQLLGNIYTNNNNNTYPSHTTSTADKSTIMYSSIQELLGKHSSSTINNGNLH